MVKSPTPYPEINQILEMLLHKTGVVLGQQMIGLYLYGSLSSGDFDLQSSDIDFAVVTDSLLPDQTISALETMHREIWASGLKWGSKLEGSYLPKSLMRCHDPAGPACPTVNEGAFYLDQRGSDWIIQRHVIREYGLVLAGPDPKTLIDPVSAADIRQAVLGVLGEWWFPMLENPTWLSQHGSEYHAFAVITMCRALHAYRYGTIVSKPKAARWAQAELGKPWQILIENALKAQAGEQPGFLEESLSFIRFAKEQIESQTAGT